MPQKILLINPPVYDYELLVDYDQPLGLLKIGQYFLNKGDRVRYFNFDPFNYPDQPIIASKTLTDGQTTLQCQIRHFGAPYSKLEEVLCQDKPDQIFITSGMTYHYPAVFDTIAVCKKVFPDVPVTLGGIYATLCPDHAKLSKADKVLAGEFAAASDLPPALELLPKTPDFVVLKSIRGCPNRCSYCAVHILEGNRPRYIDPRETIKQIKYFRERYSIKRVILLDANVLLNSRNHFEKLLDLLLEESIDVSLDISYGISPNRVNERLVKKMRQANVYDFFRLPLESAERDIYQDRFHRASSLKDFLKAVELLQAHGFNNLSVSILGAMPGQNLQGILKSMVLCWQLGVRPALLFFTPIPGTEEYRNCYPRIKHLDLADLNPLFLPFAGDPVPLTDWFELSRLAKKPFTEAQETLADLPRKSRVRQGLEKLLER